ncbi:MAG: PAS domain-containing sensor histidine kinase [Deltaproteobacteria bacterium]|nr:PAS domain-containing sensor histidine kinase [Deltaproteobacteria bacterium]
MSDSTHQLVSLGFIACNNAADKGMNFSDLVGTFGPLLDALPHATLLVDEGGRACLVSSAAKALFGDQPGARVGEAALGLVPDRFREKLAGELRSTFDHHEGAKATRRFECAGLRSGRAEFPAEVCLAPLDLRGTRYVVASFRDLTPSLQAEAKFRVLVEAAPEALMFVDSKGRITLANPQAEKLFGYSRDELVGMEIEALIPERFRSPHRRERNHYSQVPRVRPMGVGLDLPALRKDGTEFSAEISLSPVQTDNGLSTIAIIHDQTERKKAEMERIRLGEAEEALSARDAFLAIASHELKTPLAPLLMHVQSLLRAFGTGEPSLQKVRPRLEAMQSMVQRVNRLVDTLLDISRITAGRLVLFREEVDLSRLVSEVASRSREVLVRAGCELTLSINPPVVGAFDPIRIDQVVDNLLCNAAKYAPGKPVKVTVAARTGKARIAVEDQGIGVAPEDQKRIFDRFERAVSERHYGGFGLGLWVARQIVEAHGGSIWVESQPGLGATFVVELPLEDRSHEAKSHR